MKSWLARIVEFEDDRELKGILLAAAYGLFIMLGYYILRAVRDEIAAADRATSRSSGRSSSSS